MAKGPVIVGYTPHFSRALNGLPNQIQDLLTKKDSVFRENPFDGRLKTHQLRGKLKGYWSYSVNYHYRVLFKFVSDSNVIYIDVGTHEIYG